MSSVFDDLIDQEVLIATLKDAVAASKDTSNNSQNMTHAWLFTGPPGSGRSNAAIAFAAALLCEQSGCATCINCMSALDGSHADMELIRTEGLSIKVDEVRELITRTSWSPSVGNYRVVVIEDADRLTESAANALLKVIEEPGARTVWLLCAPTLTDVIPTIRSRCRQLTLRTPSIQAVAKLLIERDGIDPEMAEFAAFSTQGHIGRAKYFATHKDTQKIREKILDIPSKVKDLASAFMAAGELMELANQNALIEMDSKNESEYIRLKEIMTLTNKKMIPGSTKILKETEKSLSLKNKRLIQDSLRTFCVDLVTNQLNFVKMQINEIKTSNLSDKNKLINKNLSILNVAQITQLQIESFVIEYFLDKSPEII